MSQRCADAAGRLAGKAGLFSRRGRGGALELLRMVFRRTRLRFAFGLLLAPLGAAIWLAGCAKPPAAALERSGIVESAVVDEASGLAVSRRTPDLLWLHNDSDGQAVLYAVDISGKLRGSVRLKGVKNIDWEDMASFEFEGRAWLLVADIGDNGARRKNCVIHIVAEPDVSDLSPERELVLDVSWSVPLRYKDGSHDCESVAVDTRERKIYLLRKRTHPNALFTLPLRPDPAGSVSTAQEAGFVSNIPQPNSEQRAFPVATGRYRGNPTSMDISADGLSAMVLTYGDVLLYRRRPGESWAAAFRRTPAILPPHALEQAEAAGFSRDGGSIFVTEERTHAPVLRYRITQPSSP